MTPTTLSLASLDATAELAARIARALRPGDAVLLDGPLGGGKSALARAMLRALLADPALHVPSPTFTLVQTYESPIGSITHFDLWRIDGPSAVQELGWEEAQEGVVVVEWPDRLGPLAPADALRIQLNRTGEDHHTARLEGWPGRELPP